MTAQLLDHADTQCPKCRTPAADPKHLDYGYCEVCRAFTHLADVVLDDTFVMPKINTGGALRCCTEPFMPWITLHPGPWKVGTTMPCLYSGTEDMHGLVHCGDGLWRSAFAVEEERRRAAAKTRAKSGG